MHAVLQYLLNLDKRNYSYVGSGTIVVSGETPYNIKPKYGEILVEYGINEYVYDLEHHIWKIVAIQGNTDEILYVAFNGQYEQVFRANELIRFMDGSPYFNNVYSNDITGYASTISTIDQMISVTPDIPPTISNFLHKYNLGEYVYDLNHNIWVITSIQHNVDIVQYLAYNGIETKLFNEDELLDHVEESPYTLNKYDTLIEEYAAKIAAIDALIQQNYG